MHVLNINPIGKQHLASACKFYYLRLSKLMRYEFEKSS